MQAQREHIRSEFQLQSCQRSGGLRSSCYQLPQETSTIQAGMMFISCLSYTKLMLLMIRLEMRLGTRRSLLDSDEYEAVNTVVLPRTLQQNNAKQF